MKEQFSKQIRQQRMVTSKKQTDKLSQMIAPAYCSENFQVTEKERDTFPKVSLSWGNTWGSGEFGAVRVCGAEHKRQEFCTKRELWGLQRAPQVFSWVPMGVCVCEKGLRPGKEQLKWFQETITEPWVWCESVNLTSHVGLFCLFVCVFVWPHHPACRILVPRPGIETAPPAVEVRSLEGSIQDNLCIPNLST